ncbi:MAG: DNA polymerase IV [Gammaproteobacteria bacterium]|nr:DNA polymerase IV [Gammaproteobacteria bacterium]
MSKHPAIEPWSRAIILVDMNAFFASVEQLDHPEWRCRPVAITNGLTGTCIITSSYEARAYGVKTGMRLHQARTICPGLIQCPANPVRYAEVSTRIMKALEDITPEIEIFSVDEAFLDVTRSQTLFGSPERIGQLIKDKVFEASGLLCSVGVSGDKTTAKYAAKLNKPDGLTVIPPSEARQRLSKVRVTELCGISHGIGGFLAARGVYLCGDMKKLPIGELARRFGNPGRRIWYMCQGEDPDELQQEIAVPKTLGHGKVMPPNTRDRSILLTYLLHMSEKVVARLRRHEMVAQIFYIGLRANEGWLGRKMKTELETNDGHLLMNLCRAVLDVYWQGQGIHQVQVTALDPRPLQSQMDMFAQDTAKKDAKNTAMDHVNNRYGEFTLAPARLLNRSTMPNVIAPAWKPFGHRQTIQDEALVKNKEKR